VVTGAFAVLGAAGIGGLGLGVAATAFGFGFRHGIDWDHLAALTDLTSGESSPRRALRLATAYALGHALVVFGLGCAAIVGAEQLPPGIDSAMQRVVGATLILLAVYVAWSLVRNGREFRMRSRWMLLFAAVRRVRRRHSSPSVDTLVIEHSHPHDHRTHVHVHDHALVDSASHAAPTEHAATERHTHSHVHIGRLPSDPLNTYGWGAAFGIGMLHGVGAETPTQVVLFVAAAGVGGAVAGLGLLVAFIVGLLCSNTTVALVAAFGSLGAAKRWWLTVTVSLLTAASSLVIGVLFLTGHATSLPALFSG
jgi:High-affinity nickel-transport protein